MLDKLNIIDLLIIIFSLIEISIYEMTINKSFFAFKSLRILRAIRVLRITKLLRFFAFMKVIISVITRSINSIIYLALLLILFIYIYSLLGLQIYKNKISLNKFENQFNDFNSFSNAFITVIQIMTLEGWNNLIYIYLKIKEIKSFITYIYFISWICIGNYVLLNLFLAILLDGFANVQDSEEFAEENEKLEFKIEDKSFKDNLYAKENSINFCPSPENKNSVKKSGFSIETKSSKTKKNFKNFKNFTSFVIKLNKLDQVYEDLPCQKSLYIFSKNNFFRFFSFKVINSKYFEAIILFIIILSSLKLTGDTFLLNPISEKEKNLKRVSKLFDNTFNYVFIVEAFLKIISLGFILNEKSYLSNKWNVLDFGIACSSLIDMIFEGIDLPIIKVFRVLRAIKPLRFISHNENFKLAAIALFGSLSSLFNVFLVIFIIWFSFLPNISIFIIFYFLFFNYKNYIFWKKVNVWDIRDFIIKRKNGLL